MAESFPRLWKCPKCGSERRLIPAAWREAHPMAEKVPPVCLTQTPAVLPGEHDLVPKAVILLDDVCFDCGTRYIYHAEIVQGKVQVVEPPKKSGLVVK